MSSRALIFNARLHAAIQKSDMVTMQRHQFNLIFQV